MPAINLLPVLIFIIKKVFGKNTASRLLKLLSKNESFTTLIPYMILTRKNLLNT